MVSLRPLTPFFDWQTSHLDRNGQRRVLNFARILVYVYVENLYIFRLWKISIRDQSSHNAKNEWNGDILGIRKYLLKVVSFQYRYLLMSKPIIHILEEEINVAAEKVAKIFYCCED